MSSPIDNGNSTDSESHSSRDTLRQNPSSPTQRLSSTMSGVGDSDTLVPFGSEVQKFAQKVSATLARYKISNDLTDTNFNDWSHPIVESLQTLGYEQYLTDAHYQDNSLSTAKEARLKLIIATWILSHMDATNARRTRNHLTVYTNGLSSIDYCPCRLWKFVNLHHCSISESKLNVVSKIFHELKQPRGDTVTAFLDTFETVLAEFLKFGGAMDESQIARLFIGSLKPGYEVTIAIIYRTVIPLTFEKVAGIFRESDSEAGLSASPAIQACLASQSGHQSSSLRKPGFYKRLKCTESECQGPHDEDECFAKPSNFSKRDKWISDREAERSGRGKSQRKSASTVRGVKIVGSASANTTMMSFCTTFGDISVNNISPLAASVSDNVKTWALLDTGASHHMFNDETLFEASSIKPITNLNQRLQLAGGGVSLAVKSTGTVHLRAGDGSVFALKNCLHVPELSKSLIAGGALIRGHVHTLINESSPDHFSLVKDDLAVFNGMFAGNLMLLDIIPVSPQLQSKASTVTDYCGTLHHQRLGHLSDKYLKLMKSRSSVDGLDDLVVNQNVKCDICPLSKNTKTPHSGTRPRARRFLENVHVDLSGINRCRGLDQEMYYIMFCDDYSNYRHIYALKSKTKEEVFTTFQIYIAHVERQTGCLIRQFTVDGGGEFINSIMSDFCDESGISLHVTAAHTPEENGVSERGNRTVAQKARAMMIRSGVPLKFWYEACSTAVFLINRTVTSSLANNVTPFEMWNFRKPSVNHLKIFGCRAFTLIRKEVRESKYSPVSSIGILVGFTEDNFNYRVYDFDSRKIITSHHVSFDENSFPCLKQNPDPWLPDDFLTPSGATEDPVTPLLPTPRLEVVESEEDHGDLTAEGETTETVEDNSHQSVTPVIITDDAQQSMPRTQELPVNESSLVPLPVPPTLSIRSSTRLRGAIPSYKGMASNWDDQNLADCFNILPSAFSGSVINSGVPRSFKKAMQSSDKDLWMDACKKEIDGMMKKQVWTLVERPRGKNVIRGLWLFKIKHNPDGSINKYKSRFVAMGNTQKEGEDYNETFSPTGKPASFRLLVAMAVINGWEIHQMDAIAAFLNGDLTEDLYLEQPEGFVIPGKEHLVCKLNKSIYGLKQSPKIWGDDVKEFLLSANFTQCKIDPCTYIRQDQDKFTAIYLHVDDMAITGNDIDNIKRQIASRWDMEDLGVAKSVVGIQIIRNSPNNITLNQAALSQLILDRFDFNNLRIASTPLPVTGKLYRSSDEEAKAFAEEKRPYRQAVGSLMYLAICTRPDLSHAVGVLSQHLERPSFSHWDALVHVFRYLKGTINLGINFNGLSSSVVDGAESHDLPLSMCDADWAGDRSTRRSTTGYVFKLAGGPISWRSKLQPTVALSSTEAEYRAITEAGQELLWLRRMMAYYGFCDSNPTVLKSDNMGAIHLSSKSIFHGRTKHIEIQHHWIREVVESGDIKVEHCPTEEMIADVLTKSLGKSQFRRLRSKLGLV